MALRQMIPGGYSSLRPADVSDYWRRVSEIPASNAHYNMTVVSRNPSRLHDCASVEFFLSSGPLEHPNLAPLGVYQWIHAYRNKAAAPRAYIAGKVTFVSETDAAIRAILSEEGLVTKTAYVESKGESFPADAGEPMPARIAQYQPNQIKVAAFSDRDALLVLTDRYYPGWQAWVNGQPAPIHKVNGIFRGVSIPSGKSAIVFEFHPLSVSFGGMVSVMGTGIIGLLLLGRDGSPKKLIKG